MGKGTWRSFSPCFFLLFFFPLFFCTPIEEQLICQTVVVGMVLTLATRFVWRFLTMVNTLIVKKSPYKTNLKK